MSTRDFLEKAEAYLLGVIEDRRQDFWAKVLRAVLGAFSGLFRGLVQLRLWLYAHGLLRPHELGCQVISIGNLTVGGTGKTPIVEVFARTLQKSGRKVAILSRGYKQGGGPLPAKRLIKKLTFEYVDDPPRVVSDGQRLLLDSSLSGDEPFMLATNLPNGVAVIVDARTASRPASTPSRNWAATR
jgi:tetraacyldisaccharide 4'-kinase